MCFRNALRTIGGVVLIGVLAGSSTGAWIPDSKRTTYFSFPTSVALPGVALAPGTYIFELAAPDSARNLVRVMSRDHKRVYLTAFTNVVERPASGKMDAVIVLGESNAKSPAPIRAWYPAGERSGRQFIY
jgi:hypothetical protein